MFRFVCLCCRFVRRRLGSGGGYVGDMVREEALGLGVTHAARGFISSVISVFAGGN